MTVSENKCNIHEWEVVINVKLAIFQAYHGKNKLHFIDIMSDLFYTNTLSWMFSSSSSLKQQSADRDVAPLGHIFQILSQPVNAVFP